VLPGPPGPRPGGEGGVVRTAAEQHAFADAWLREGIVIGDVDTYHRCPFHPDTHPSLHVDPVGCRWYCFGCHRGGGPGALRALFGEPRPATTRSRLRGVVGRPQAITLDGNGWIDAVGESHHQDELLALVGQHRSYGGVELDAVAELVPEPAHPIDPQAVAVRIDGRPIGYLARAEARRLRPAIDAARSSHGHARCRARIRGGWDRGHGNLGAFGVQLRLPIVSMGTPDRPDPRSDPLAEPQQERLPLIDAGLALAPERGAALDHAEDRPAVRTSAARPRRRSSTRRLDPRLVRGPHR
jgi:hypothetical protein